MSMTPRERKAALVLKGRTMAEIARALKVEQGHVSQVVGGKRRSPKVEQAVAVAIGRPVSEVFPPVASLEGAA